MDFLRIFEMRRLWLALSLPTFAAVFAGQKGLFVSGIAWIPVSTLLLVWAVLSYKKEKKDEENARLLRAAYLNRDKGEIKEPNFHFDDATYTFSETFSGIIIDSDPNNDLVWVKSDKGNETQLSTYGVPFRKSHQIKKYELLQYHNDGSCNVYKESLIINNTTKEYCINLQSRTFIIFGFLTIVAPQKFIASLYLPLRCSAVFTISFFLLNVIAAITFFTLLFTFKYDYVFYTYLLSKIGCYFCIKWAQTKDSKFRIKLRNLASHLDN